MIYLTMIARVADGLPLAASIQEDEQVEMCCQRSALQQFGSERLPQSPSLMILEIWDPATHPAAHPACPAARCPAARPAARRPAARPATCPADHTYIQKTKKSYVDSRARRNLSSINAELQDVQRIMVANMEDVLQRGEALSALDTKASNLSSLAKKYRSDAKFLNTRSAYAKVAAAALVFITFIIYVRFWWL
uniref:SEC22 homolog B, vesicle trafficking protein n=1 Tax=Cyprinodon variegatus TaxID=28743 RepID=A0A3Q2DD13_CYPVA